MPHPQAERCADSRTAEPVQNHVSTVRPPADSGPASSTTGAGTVCSSSWLKQLGPLGPADPGTVEVVCFPHSGGGAGVFRRLGEELRGHARVVGVQYPGRLDRIHEPVVTDLHELADRTAESLREAATGTPRVFLGHSMGAILAYEVAQRLGSAGLRALVVSGRPAPSRVQLTTSHLLDDTALVDEVLRLGGTAAEVLENPEMRALLLPLIRGDYRASETYRPRGDGPLGCDLVAMTGDADPVASSDEVRAWSGHTTGRFRLEVLNGGHFFIQDHWPAVAAIVRSTLDR